MNRSQVILVVFGFILSLSIQTSTGYDGGLIFYNIETNQKILPPIVTSTKYSDDFRLPFVGEPCTCSHLVCGCCAGMKVDLLHFNQRMCANVTYNIQELEVEFNVFLNNRNIIMYKLSALNPPPICIPVQFVVPISLCMKVYDIYTVGANVHLCINWIVKVLSNDVFVLHFNCVQLGTNGFEWLSPTGEQLLIDDQIDSNVYDAVHFDRKRSLAIIH